MSARQIGLVLRLLGPLLQVVALALLLGGQANREPFRSIAYTLFGAGLVLVLIGVAISSGRRSLPRPPAEQDRFRL